MTKINQEFDLSGKVVLVTGGSRGLGKEMVHACAAAGADVIIASRKLENCEILAVEVEATYGVSALAYGCHVGQWEQLQGLVDAAYQRFGRVDVLVNNAGMSPLYESLDKVDEALFDKVIDVNLKGPFRLSALIAKRMMEGAGGTILNISSIAAIRPRGDIVPYAAAKAGLNAMTEGMARAYGPQVRVNAIMCGAFYTDISQAWDMPKFQERAKSFALGRGGEPHEIVGAALYFVSDASRFCTGAILRLDGGTP